jgi:hypothetical protein
MNPTIRRRRLAAYTLSALAAFSSSLQAADWYLQANSGLNTNWDTPTDWWSQPTGGGSHPAAITSADNFYVNGFTLRSPQANTATTFSGGALILNGGSILLKQSNSTVVTIPALLSKGGASRAINNGNSVVQALNITDVLLNRSETTSFSTSGTTRGLTLGFGNLRGDGDLNFLGGGTVNLGITTGTGFYGALYVTGSTTLTITSDATLKGSLVIEAGSKINLNQNLSVTSLVVGGTTTDADGLPGIKRTGTAFASNTTYTFAQLQAAFPAVFLSGSGSITVTQPVLSVDAANVVDNVGVGQLGANMGSGKFWSSATPNYRADLNRLKMGMVRVSVYPHKDITAQNTDSRVAQILNAGGVPLFVAPINKPAPPYTTAQQAMQSAYFDLAGNTGSGTAATNVAYLVQRYKAPPYNLTTQYWEIGNEPDISIDYQVASGQEYVDIYQSVHNQLVASGVRGNVQLCGPVVAAEYGFAMNYGRTDNILNAFFQQCGSPLNGFNQVEILTRHVYATIYDWETNAPKTTDTAYNLLNAQCEQVTFTQTQSNRWSFRGEGAIQAKLNEYGFPASVGTGVTEMNVPDIYRHTITQGLWFLTFDHFALYNSRNILSSGFVFDSTSNPLGYYKSDKTPSFAFWATHIHNNLTGDSILAQNSSEPHLLVTATKDDTYVYVQVLNRNDADMTASVNINNAPVTGTATMFELTSTATPDAAVPTSLGTSFSYTFPAMTTRVFRYLRSDAPAVVTPPGPPTNNVVIDTSFDTTPTNMLTYYSGFQPVVTGGNLKLTSNTANMTAAVVFNGQSLATSQKRMQARFGYRIDSGHAGTGIVFGAYSANPGVFGAAGAGLGYYGQPNGLWGVEIQSRNADQIAIFAGSPNSTLEGLVSQTVAPYPFGYFMDMFVVVDYDGDAGTVRARLYQGTSDTGTPVADITNRLGNPATLPAGTVFGFTGSTGTFNEITSIQNLKITTDNGAALIAGTPFTLQSWSSAPWSLTSGATSFSAVFSPDGIPVTMTFGNSKTGVGISVPASPNFGTATNSFFGVEGTGFGVGETTVGRFDRGESFTLQANHAFTLQQINWREWTGDEVVHVQWTSGGVVQQQLFTITAALFTFTGVNADANTPVIFTNVSGSTANLNGRLRVNQVITALLN